MKRTVTIVVLGIVAFAAIVLARLPASWLLPTGGTNFSCASVDGSLWSGYCSGLKVRGTPLGDLAWQLRPARLFLGKLAAHVDLEHPPTTSAQGDVEIGIGGTVVARNLTASLPLDPTLLPGVPPTLSGAVHLDLTLAKVTRNGVVNALEGRIEASDLVDRSGYVTPLGNFAVTFPGGQPTPTGEVQDIGGPLAVTGKLVLTPQPGYDLSGYVTPRASATQPLVNAIQFLGSPDAQGRRPFALSGTY
ncbi:MAG TPA: type II secretion system protein N [Steroidobacteraceae bacterium]|nr:type II secretion system protein N [Steroidobacteraceae bacterium]